MLVARILLAFLLLQLTLGCGVSPGRETRQTSQGLHIRDAVRMKNEVPNELIGIGLVVGLQGTGDSGDFAPTAVALGELMKHFDMAAQTEKVLKNANNAALVCLSMSIPPAGAHAGERLDVKVSALAARSLKGGQLVIVPMYAPRADMKVMLASACGSLILPDEKNLTEAVIVGGGVLLEDVLPEEIENNTFTLIIHPNLASYELATAIADQINELAFAESDVKTVAVAVDSTQVRVTIPEGERANPTPFIARLLKLPLPTRD